MRIDPVKRFVQVSAREISEFSTLRRAGSPGTGRWRTDAGRKWHESVQRELADQYEKEIPLTGDLQRGKWTLHVEGRCDLRSIPDGTPPILGEIKTLSEPLPLPEDELRARHPAHFRQIALYSLLAQDAVSPKSFLLFIDPDSGIRQQVWLERKDIDLLERHIDLLLEFLDDVEERTHTRSTLQWESFAKSPRCGQIEASRLLGDALPRSRVIGFQAPTGFGKTRIVLEEALAALRSGKAERILYLTGKTSGQEQACAELQSLFPTTPPLRTYRMRNHREHAAICPLDGCHPGMCAPTGETERAGTPVTPSDHPGFPREAWRRIAENSTAHRCCPYEISRAFLAFSDLWIADYNYLFGPGSQHIFFEQPGFDPLRTWVLIDEAHNLPDRACSALGGTLSEDALLRTADNLRSTGCPRPLLEILRELARAVRDLPPQNVADADATYRILDLTESMRDVLGETRLPWETLEPVALETLRCTESVDFLFSHENLDPVFWSPAPSALEWLPLDPVPWIDECLQDFACALFFSATLEPFPFSSPRPVFKDKPHLVRINAPKNDRFRVAIDPSVETTRRHRKKHYARTARTAAAFAESANGCVVLYFPSYEYASAIETFLHAEAPHLRTQMQPRDLDAEERENFARNAPLACDILLLMLGGTFAEAIDSFGGIIRRAMIIGPGLPELSAVNRLRMQSWPDREQGFHEICRVTGMRRVNQAIGRFIRAEDHHAEILLHDKRFLEPGYRNLLREDIPDPPVLKTETALLTWLSKTQ